MYDLKYCREIRLYPLHPDDFPSCEFAKLFIKMGFHENGEIKPGVLTYRSDISSGAPLTFFYRGAFILFQYAGEIIGCGVFKNSEETSIGTKYYMDMDTVCVFENNITLEEFKSVVKDFKKFNSTAQKIDIAFFSEIIKLINKRKLKSKLNLDDNTSILYNTKEGGIIEYYTTKYERVEKYRKEAIRIHGLSCEVCGFNFSERYGRLGNSYIEVHHKIPLHSLDEEIVPNPKTDMACVCSNCHRMLHRSKYEVMEVEALKQIVKKQRLAIQKSKY